LVFDEAEFFSQKIHLRLCQAWATMKPVVVMGQPVLIQEEEQEVFLKKKRYDSVGSSVTSSLFSTRNTSTLSILSQLLLNLESSSLSLTCLTMILWSYPCQEQLRRWRTQSVTFFIEHRMGNMAS
jgi:hypothetical protein